MKLAGDILFNLEINTIASFWLGLGVAFGLHRALRLRERRSALFLFALPVLKVVFDVSQGIPRDSFFWAAREGHLQRLGSFQIGVGVSPLFRSVAFPRLNGELWALHDQGRSPQSVADLAARALDRWVTGDAAAIIGWAILAISIALLAARGARLAGARVEARRWRTGAVSIGKRMAGRRMVDIAVSETMDGVPFTGGIFRPYVLIPQKTYDALRPVERDAVVGHELAHAARLDLLWLVGAAALADCLWYIPGVRSWLRRLRALIELRADRAAVEAGVRPEVLASTLIRVGELTLPSALEPGLARSGKKAIRQRVERLLDPDPARGPARRFVSMARSGFIAWVAIGVLASVCLGNHIG